MKKILKRDADQIKPTRGGAGFGLGGYQLVTLALCVKGRVLCWALWGI